MRIPIPSAMPRSWVVVGLCMLTTMAVAFIYMGLGVLLPFIQEDLQTNRAQLGLIVSGLVAGQSVTVLLVGWLADVIGVRKLQTIALAGVVLGLLLFSQMQSLVQGVLFGFLLGICLSASFPASTKAIMDWVAPQRRGAALGLAQANIPLGGIIAAVLLAFISVTYSWRAATIVVAVIVAVSSLIFFAFYRDKPANLAEGGTSRKLAMMVPLVAKNRDIWLAAFFGIAFGALWSVVVSYLVLFLKENQGMSAVKAAGLLSVATAGDAVARVGWGLVTDLLMGGRRIPVLAMVGGLSVLAMSFMTMLPSDASTWVVLLLVLFVGATTLAWGGLYAVLLAELVGPTLTGTAIGFAATIQYIGAFGLIPIFGLIVDRTESYDMGWWMMAGVAGVGTSLLAFIRRPSR